MFDSLAMAIPAFILALIVLMKGADWLIDGAAFLAQKWGISELIVGLTVISLGTSLPELVVSIQAATQGKALLSYGNVVGSNITNVLLVLGTTALVRPIPANNELRKRDIPIGTALLAVLAAGLVLQWDGADSSGQLPRSLGLVLLFFVPLYGWWVARDAKSQKEQPGADSDDGDGEMGVSKALLLTVVGLLAILGGGHFTVESAIAIARIMEISEATIGLTIVALGTSLPELVASVAAARRGFSGLALGNVIGSNFFNIALVLGTAVTIRPFGLGSTEVFDGTLMLTVCFGLMAVLAWSRHGLGRVLGGLFLCGYFGYMLSLAWR